MKIPGYPPNDPLFGLKLFLPLIPFVLAFVIWSYWHESQYEPAREELAAEASETATSDMAAAKIWIGRRYEALHLCVAFNDEANIAALAGLLQGANPSPAPGHVNPEFDFRLDINSMGSGRTHYSGTTYLQFQDDAYIWPSGKDNSVSRLDKIRIPKLGTWIRELARENGCY